MDQVQDTTPPGQFAWICVFCGSSSGKKSIYTAVAQQLGTELVTRGIDLVYGGGSIGLMGTVAHAAHDAGGHVVGVIPRALMPKEICGNTVGDLVVVDDMHQRKAEMARRADAFIALPGGFGTFEEVLEMITWAQLGIHKKPVGLLNVDGFYDAMLALFDKALEAGFLNLASHNIVLSAPTAAELLEKLENFAPIVDKSVQELTWDSTTGVSASSSSTDGIKSAVVHNSNVHLSRSTSGARASNTTQIRTKVVTTNGVSGRNNIIGAAGSGNLVLPNFLPPRAGRFSVRQTFHTISPRAVYGFIARSGSNAVAVKVGNHCSAGASLGAGRVVLS